MYIKLLGINSGDKMTLEERFNFLNSYIHVISPLIRKFGGFIDKYTDDGILAVFGQAENVLDCAHAITRAINVKNRQNKSLPNVEQRISIMTGEVIFGIVGEEERKLPSIISDVLKNLDKLDEICRVMSAKVVFTKSVLDDLPLSYKFLYRYIGKFNNEDQEILAFEDIDVLPRDITSRLIQSKSEFERGIIVYESGDYKEASALFASALKTCPNDKGCYVYFNRCQEKLND